MENGTFAPQDPLWKMEHLLLRRKCSIFHNILENLTFQRHPKAPVELRVNRILNIHASALLRMGFIKSVAKER